MKAREPDVSMFGAPALALPRSYLMVMEAAREPGALQRERALAHIIDALLVVILCMGR